MPERELPFWRRADAYADLGMFGNALATLAVLADYLEEAEPRRARNLRWLAAHGKYPAPPVAGAAPGRFFLQMWNWYAEEDLPFHDHAPAHAALPVSCDALCEAFAASLGVGTPGGLRAMSKDIGDTFSSLTFLFSFLDCELP